MDANKLLEYKPFSSSINPSFWNKLTELKLNVDKLDEREKTIWGYFSNIDIQTNPLLEVDSTSFNSNYDTQNTQLPMQGVLENKNTIDAFKECDKWELIKREGAKIWKGIVDGDAIKNPSMLNQFFILSFADLKKFHYYYWFAFPALSNIDSKLNKIENVNTAFNEEQISKVTEAFLNLPIEQKAFFLISLSDYSVKIIDSCIGLNNETNLTNYNEFVFAFYDSCNSLEYSGWTIKNFISFLIYNCPVMRGKEVKFLSFRLGRKNSRLSAHKSLIFNLTLPDIGDINKLADYGWIGWERNERNKLGPRMSNMKQSLDPKCLAESSVDLNLKLMKWRLLPDIDLERIKSTKCLLLGAGTLGCSVARVLLGWGVRNINFVDNSNVSYSNPVRQSLFAYEDCVQGKSKAEAAAENLGKIFPGVNSTGYNLKIPMPGHPVGEALLQQTKDSIATLIKLIEQSDVVFLLLDSRESRWLPTVLCQKYKKLAINAALGFDTYLVMRHGVRYDSASVEHPPIDGFKVIGGDSLGCYFCNDITAPGNSLKDRTLDQQCTVTRPGVSQIAGALAVELTVSVLQHKHGVLAPAYYQTQKSAIDNTERDNECMLGIIPHSIRGFLTTFSHVLPATERYKQCIACSEPILQEYERSGLDFFLRALETSNYLEEITGLNQIYDNDSDICEYPDDDDDDDDD